VIAAGVLLLAYRPLLSPRSSLLWGYEVRRAARLAELDSPDPQRRKQAAWSVIERPDPRLTAVLAERLFGDEADPDVRESYVYALGKLADLPARPAIQHVLHFDPSAYVRSAAWLAAARIDPAWCQSLLQESPPPQTAWDRLGRAQAGLTLGDPDAPEPLLALAAASDASLRVAAARVLNKTLATAMDALGAWPLDEPRGDGAAWTPERVERIRSRLGELQSPPGRAALTRELVAAGRGQVGGDEFRSLLGRLLGARARVAQWLDPATSPN
jgi:HEAT repeat protein